MVEADKAVFSKALYELAAALRVEVTKPLLAGYWRGLEELPIDSVLTAIDKAFRVSEFMPSVAELRGLAPKGETRFFRGAGMIGPAPEPEQVSPWTEEQLAELTAWRKEMEAAMKAKALEPLPKRRRT
jgi:hypothetical protein